jgi:hypothetical protein
MREGVRTIYEATFEYNGVLAQVDILNRVPNSVVHGWELIEAKSSLAVAESHLFDIALQTWILTSLEIPIERCVLLHVNRDCVFPDLDHLFIRADVTEQVRSLLPDMDESLFELRDMLRRDEPPDIDIGPHCSSPVRCHFRGHCWSEKCVPQPSVFDLPGIGQKAWKLYGAGIVSLDSIDPAVLTPAQRKAQHAHLSGERWIDRRAVAKALSKWSWPLHFLDFETANPAIPRYPGTAPYELVPFQFSCHIQERIGIGPTQVEYLHDDATDPRGPLSAALVSAIGSTGSVVAYNMAFERSCLKLLGNEVPELKKALDSIADRLVDPLPILRKAVYDPKFGNSFGMKSVAPALLGEEFSYSDLVVSNGEMAQLAFEELIRLPQGSPRHTEIRQALLEYCGRDTLSLVKLVEWLWMNSLEQ